MLKRPTINGLSLALVFIASTPSHASDTLLTHLNKSERGDWSVEYKTSEPIKRIVFHNSPNGSRVDRWSSNSGDFEITYQEKQESIQRKDGEPFTTAKFSLTSTYTHLPKNYGPFSPLSNGGMIIHSGRFFACADVCGKRANNWQFSLTVPSDEHIILNGEVLKETASWSDRDSGKSIYTGKQKPAEAAGTLSIIDQGLPPVIRQSLDKNIPKLMLYFEKNLGKLSSNYKPTLFASYSNRPGKSTQGGVLPNQIFMHWDTDDLEEKANNDDFLKSTLKTFAHETAHFFQSTSTFNSTAEAWVHEGSAELFAINALLELYPDTKNYVEAFKAKSVDQCIEALKTLSLEKASENGKFQMHYHCGMLIHQRIEQGLTQKKTSLTLYEIWQEYRENVVAGSTSGQQTFLNVVEAHTSFALRQKIETFIAEKHADPQLALNTLFE